MVEIKYSCIATPPDEISAEKNISLGMTQRDIFMLTTKTSITQILR